LGQKTTVLFDVTNQTNQPRTVYLKHPQSALLSATVSQGVNLQNTAITTYCSLKTRLQPGETCRLVLYIDTSGLNSTSLLSHLKSFSSSERVPTICEDTAYTTCSQVAVSDGLILNVLQQALSAKPHVLNSSLSTCQGSGIESCQVLNNNSSYQCKDYFANAGSECSLNDGVCEISKSCAPPKPPTCIGTAAPTNNNTGELDCDYINNETDCGTLDAYASYGVTGYSVNSNITLQCAWLANANGVEYCQSMGTQCKT
ncbi:MAG: hypothetical protein P1U32_02570, partial [Legionellaceae bacterium]|nr:hypothetical protein [Legionellaceae bacterium]